MARYGANEDGASVIEHGLLACIFSLVIVYAVASGWTAGKIYQRIALMTEMLTGDEDTGKAAPAITRSQGQP